MSTLRQIKETRLNSCRRILVKKQLHWCTDFKCSEVFFLYAMLLSKFAVNSCDAQIKDLKAHVARLNTELNMEHEKMETVQKELGAEKRNTTELEASNIQLAADLNKAMTAHLPCNDLFKELKACVASLDKDLATEKERTKTLAKVVAEDKLNAAELESKLRKLVAELAQDKLELEEDKKVRMGGGLVREVRSAICV
jgi:chromosome segregation ATPase